MNLTNIEQLMKSLFPRLYPETFVGFKVSGNRWVGWWTNNTRDKDGEIFTQKAIDDFISQVKSGALPYPELWFSHIRGSKHGQADNLWRLGHFAVASGTFDNTPMAKAFQSYYKSRGDMLGMSHGFKYYTNKKINGIYHQFATFEISPLLKHQAANSLTYWELTRMPVSDETRAELVKILGESGAKALLEASDVLNKQIEASGVDTKAQEPPTTPVVDMSGFETRLKGLETALGAQTQSLSAFNALPDILAQVKAALGVLAEQQVSLQKRLLEQDALRPPASYSKDTLLDEYRKELLKEVETKSTTEKPLIQRVMEGSA